MTAQIYDTNNNNFLSVYIPNKPPYFYDFYLGEFSPWTAIKNTHNEFISLGGDKENPLIYKYQNTGVTDFTFSILGPTSPEQRNLPPEKAIYPSLAYYELWIDGIKPYYFYFGLQNETIFTRTVSVVANKDQTTKFRFRLTFYFSATTYQELQKFYFEGKEDTIYSSITAKFIPEITASQSPIIVLGTTQEIVPGVTHIIKSTTQCLLSLPATYPIGVSTKIISYNDNGYKILQKDGQVIKAVGRTTTIGTGGSMTFNDKYSQVNIDCIDANKTFVLNNITGGFLTD